MPAVNPNANRGEHVKPKPAKKKVVGKVKPATSQRGTSPSGDRPQGRAKEMRREPSHRAMLKDPNTGREQSTLKTPEAPRGSQQRGKSPSGDRPQGRAKEMRDAPTHARVKKGHGPGTVLATLSPTKLAGKYVAAVNWKDPRGTVSGGVDIGRNAAMDAAELAVTTPSSVAKIATTAATHPKKLPRMLAQPYIDLAKDPKKAISEHPVSTALMLQPAVRVPGRVVGKAVRAAGKQTLERPAATLPHTALKETRQGSKDVAVRAVQARADKTQPPPSVTVHEVHRRVDEFHDVARQHRNRAQNTAARQAKERGLTGEDATQHMSDARAGANDKLAKRFAEEFGAVHQIHRPTEGARGVMVVPKGATKGTLHDTRADAAHVVARLNQKPATVPTGRGKETVPLEFTVRPVGDKFAAVPKVAAARLMQSRLPSAPQAHSSVGSGKQTVAKVMRRSRQAFTQAVLPLSPKWLAGQGVEAGLRSVVAGAGPMDLLRTNRVVKRLNRESPGLGDEVLKRISGGQFGLTGTARDYAGGKSLAEDFAGTSLERPAKAATRVGQTPPLRVAQKGWSKYTNTVLDAVNGSIENTARKAMAGHELKSRFMDRRLVGLTDKALEDAARGLRGTENQAALGRTVDRMYGKYSKFSPERRSLLLHWTPFLPWYLNVATFLTKVLPVDHPVKTALLADISMATEDWRKEHHLSLRDADHVPPFLLGSYPTGGDKYLRVGHYVPFAPADVVGAAGDLALPQATGTLLNALGVDWKGQRLKHPGYKGKEFNQGERAVRALVTAAEAQIPGVSQAGRITGVTPRLVDKKNPDTIPDLRARLLKELPTTPTKSATKKATGTASVTGRVKVPGSVTGRVKVPGSATGRVKVPGG